MLLAALSSVPVRGKTQVCGMEINRRRGTPRAWEKSRRIRHQEVSVKPRAWENVETSRAIPFCGTPPCVGKPPRNFLPDAAFGKPNCVES